MNKNLYYKKIYICIAHTFLFKSLCFLYRGAPGTSTSTAVLTNMPGTKRVCAALCHRFSEIQFNRHNITGLQKVI